ncbi:hypothetical protein FNV62_29445 [Streptomyces sp. RLB3-17]|uniref:Lipoprotein CseA n=1 Tax=Streptomyces mirabilis TaxID=68239 RepID=A0ABU3UNJ2_9ACTN|nr:MULTISPECIES: hypothetical protein [Streptomyces]MCX4610819.1 hypothetical protein [Streptomyces mirabilis]MCX5351034.1 hypothetical protein [Streptomyces mirabilis]MDU8995487.1 hypothetical protein [Streptomyces mirabilis]QDN83883.1 hypothetical protein FNV64_32205 [Streptomyces sp. S1A1-7]QDN94206.1 hypothetical protein FNV61_30475 [Streptomyces sp. RLB3-6]
MKAGSAVTAALAALGLFLTACATGGTGARDEGPASSEAVAKGAAPSPARSASPSKTPKRVDAIKLVKDDPEVSDSVKSALTKPCVADEYPVDVSYGDLTGGTTDDVVVNVMTCGDAVGIGSYVYREESGRYENVFKTEEPPVYAEIDRGDLVITQQLYKKGDPVEYPSSEEVITYGWTATHFTERSRTHNDYSNAVGGVDTPAPAN